MNALTLELPQTVSTRFLIGHSAPLRDLAVDVRGRIDAPVLGADPYGSIKEVKAHALDLLAMGAVTFVTEVAERNREFSGLLWAAWCAHDGRERFHTVMTVTVPLLEMPAAVSAAWVLADAVSHVMSGVVIDLDAVRSVPAGAILSMDGFRLADWVSVYALPEGRAACLVGTAGMGRFGLPELVVAAGADEYETVAGNLLRAVAYRLFLQGLNQARTRSAGWGEQIPPGVIDVARSGDLWLFWGAQRFCTGSVPLVATDPGDGAIVVSPIVSRLCGGGVWEEVAKYIPPVMEAAPRVR